MNSEVEEFEKCRYCGHVVFPDHMPSHMEASHWEVMNREWIDRVAGAGTQ